MPRPFDIKKGNEEDSNAGLPLSLLKKEGSTSFITGSFELTKVSARGNLSHPVVPAPYSSCVWSSLNGFFLPHSPAIYRPHREFSPEIGGSDDTSFIIEKAKIGEYYLEFYSKPPVLSRICLKYNFL